MKFTLLKCCAQIFFLFYLGFLSTEQVEDLTLSKEPSVSMCQDNPIPAGTFVMIIHYKCSEMPKEQYNIFKLALSLLFLEFFDFLSLKHLQLHSLECDN